MATLKALVFALLLGSCHAGDDNSGLPKSQCLIQALETIAANSPEKNVEIETIFASPQHPSDVTLLLQGSDLQPIEIRMLIDGDSTGVAGNFESLDIAFAAIQDTEFEPFTFCWPQDSAADPLPQMSDENSCEFRIERLTLRGPAYAALAFRAKADSIATTSRLPSKNELIEFLKAQFRQADDASIELLDCTQVKQQLH